MTNLLLQVIQTCGRSPYQLAKEAGIKDSQIYQFVKVKRALKLPSADRLVNALNLELSASVKAPHK